MSVQEIGVNVAVASHHAARITFCLFDERGEKETARFVLPREEGDVFCGFIAGLAAGRPLRAEGRRAL